MILKRSGLIFIVLLTLLTLFINTVGAGCTPASTPGDDVITCTDILIVDVVGDNLIAAGSGNDVITIIGSTGDVYGDSFSGIGSGNDVITVTGTSWNIYGDSFTGAGSGNDVITVTGVARSIYGDSAFGAGSGNDVIIVTGTAGIIYGDSAFGAGSGNDVIIVTGTTGDIAGDSGFGAGSGNDVITVTGTALNIYGDSGFGAGSGNDVIIVTGTALNIYGDNQAGTGSGNDVITVTTGTVLGDIIAGGGDDRVVIGGVIGGLIDGGHDFDILEFAASICVGSGGTLIGEAIAFANSNPAGDTATINGNTYTWSNFEELRAIMEVYFCDGRNENQDFGTPLVSYCNIYGGVDIFDVNELGVDGRSVEGILTIRTDQEALLEILALAVSTGQNQLIATDAFGNQFWALSSHELQIMGAEVNEPSKLYTYILDPAHCGL